MLSGRYSARGVELRFADSFTPRGEHLILNRPEHNTAQPVSMGSRSSFVTKPDFCVRSLPMPLQATSGTSSRPAGEFLFLSVVATLIVLLIGNRSARSAPPDNDSKPAPNQMELLKTFMGEFVEITPGEGRYPESFAIGSEHGPESERPVTKITLQKNFAIARYEVPQNLYTAVMGENPSRWTGPRNSVEMMDFQQAMSFCRRITKLLHEKELLSENEEIRLPGEAEWEYCCRAGTSTRYSFGDKAREPGDTGKQADVLDDYGWHTGNAAGNDPPVGALKPNPWGLYDMHGYLWEFVLDDWSDSHAGIPRDGSPRKLDKDDTKDDTRHVVRGGSWREPFDRLTSSARAPVEPDFKRDDIGFRCVRAGSSDRDASTSSR